DFEFAVAFVPGLLPDDILVDEPLETVHESEHGNAMNARLDGDGGNNSVDSGCRSAADHDSECFGIRVVSHVIVLPKSRAVPFARIGTPFPAGLRARGRQRLGG